MGPLLEWLKKMAAQMNLGGSHSWSSEQSFWGRHGWFVADAPRDPEPPGMFDNVLAQDLLPLDPPDCWNDAAFQDSDGIGPFTVDGIDGGFDGGFGGGFDGGE